MPQSNLYMFYLSLCKLFYECWYSQDSISSVFDLSIYFLHNSSSAWQCSEAKL